MKKNILLWSMIAVIFIVFLLVIVFMIYNPKNTERQKNKEINYQEFGKYIALQDVPQNYSFEQALQDECVVITNKQVYNMEKLEEFIENTKINSKKRISDLIRIIQYTREGDMLITDVCYKLYQNTYIVATDNTRDKFGENQDKKITIKNDFPGNFYGITKTEDEDYTKIELALYAQEIESYEEYEIASYLKSAKINDKGPNFIGTVEKVNGKAVLVKTDDKSMEFECDKYSFVIPEKQQIQLKEGDKVLVIYTGTIRTTYPAQIDIVEIQKLD